MQQTERSENFPFSSQNFLTLIFAMSLMSLSRTDCFTAVARGYSTTRNGKVEQLILLSGLHGELLYHADTTHNQTEGPWKEIGITFNHSLFAPEQLQETLTLAWAKNTALPGRTLALVCCRRPCTASRLVAVFIMSLTNLAICRR